MSPPDQLLFTRLTWDVEAAVRAALDGMWIVVNRIDGGSTADAEAQPQRGRDAPPLGYYDEWYVFAGDPGVLCEALPSFVNDGNLSLLFSSEDSFGRRDRDLLGLRSETAVHLGYALDVSKAVALIWGLEELLIAERPELGLAQGIRTHVKPG